MGQFEMKSVVTVKCESERCKRVLNVSADPAMAGDEKKLAAFIMAEALKQGWALMTTRTADGTKSHLVCSKCSAYLGRRFLPKVAKVPATKPLAAAPPIKKA